MKVKAAILTALIGLAAVPAQAQPRWVEGPGYYEGLPMRMIMRIVRREGLDPVARPVRRGSHYHVIAADDFGRVQRVVIDARSGGIVAIRSAGPPARRDRDFAMRPPARIPPAGLRRDYDADGARPRLPPLRPRASIPNDADDADGPTTGRLSSPPSPAQTERSAPPAPTVAPSPKPRTAAVNPTARTPVPRPRPAERAAPETKPSASQGATPAENGAKHRPLPRARVVLPGGPTPTAERAAENRPGQREHVNPPPQPAPQAAPSAEKPANAIPPMQGLE